MNHPNHENTHEEIASLKLMTIFFSIFGCMLWVAILFTKSVRGKIVDAITGLLFLLIALFSWLFARRLKQNLLKLNAAVIPETYMGQS